MPVFPAQYSLLSSAALGSYIANAYGLDGFTCKLLVHNLSDAYLLEGDDARYIFKVFTDAYRELRPVSDDELAAIPYLGVMFWIYFLEVYVLNFEDWSNTFLTPHFVKDRMALIRNWVAWYCRF